MNRGKQLIWLPFIALLLTTACKKGGSDGPAPEQRRQYQESNAIFPNPERGFVKTMNVFSEGAALSPAQIDVLRAQNVTMIVRVFYLDAFKNTALSTTQLNLISGDLGRLRTAGLKVIIRFAYTDAIDGTDAPFSIISQHLDQLKPLFEENQDVIAFVQAGFIGAWGEWHSSSNGLSTTANRKLVLDKLLSVVPQGLMVQVRTPGYKQEIFATTNAIGSDVAYSNQNIARVGHHNDCFLSGGTDYGTYTQLPAQKNYISAEANYVPTGGETCPPTGGFNPNCVEGRTEMKLLKWTYLNLDWYVPTITAWRNSGCFDEFQRALGYRFALESSKLPAKASVNGQLAVDIVMLNRGYAPVYKQKHMAIVLKSASGQYYELPVNFDLRTVKPGMTTDIIQNVSLSGVPAGTYSMYLRIADAATSIRARLEYSIQLANTNMWVTEHGGMNNLDHQLTIE